jgi:RND family efflux transporter MFP subunit
MKAYIFLFFIGFSAAFSACKSNAEIDEHAGHDHGEVKILLTGYSNSFEIFAEADPFIVGKPSSVLVHLTHIENFKPLTVGKVTLSLIVGTKGIRQSLDVAERPGIYRFSIVPEAEGAGKVYVDIESGTFKNRVEVVNVNVYADEHNAIHEAEEQAIQSSNAIVFTKEQSWKVDFATENPLVEPFGQIIKTVAQVQPAQGDEVVVTAKTNGVVSLLETGLQEGRNVTAGQLLLTISGSGLAENSWNVRFAEAKNNYEKAKVDYERMSELAKDKIIPERELVAAQTEFENAKALFDNMNSNFNAKGQRVLSPISGFTKQLFVQNGQYVEVGQPIIAVSQNRSLQLTADVQQKYASVLGAISSANIRTLSSSKTYTLKELNGKVVSYGRSVNPDNFLVPVILQIDNKGEFVPGSFVELYLKVLSNSVALTVPNTALLEEQGSFFVFVQLSPELFEKRVVQTGATDGTKTEILKGIDKNDRIVAKGAILVKLAQASAALDPHSGHVH